MTGDAEDVIEKAILKSGEQIKAQILKIAHHGSSTSCSKEFLDLVNPSYALISCGLKNKYNHPSEETIKKLEKRNIEILRTDKLGMVVATITTTDIKFS